MLVSTVPFSSDRILVTVLQKSGASRRAGLEWSIGSMVAAETISGILWLWWRKQRPNWWYCDGTLRKDILEFGIDKRLWGSWNALQFAQELAPLGKFVLYELRPSRNKLISRFNGCVVKFKHGRLRFPSSGFFNHRNRRSRPSTLCRECDWLRCTLNGLDIPRKQGNRSVFRSRCREYFSFSK